MNDYLLKKAHDYFAVLMVALLVGITLFNAPFVVYRFGQYVGPKIGEMVFELTHPNELGKMTYTVRHEAPLC